MRDDIKRLIDKLEALALIETSTRAKRAASVAPISISTLISHADHLIGEAICEVLSHA